MSVRVALVLVMALVTRSTVLGAQLPDVGGPRPEFRLDVRPVDAAEVGLGLSVPTSFYLRFGGLVSGGVVRDGDTTRATARIEANVRIPFDPLYERRWAPYVTTGAALACAESRRCQPLLVLRVGIEGPASARGWTPAFEAGVGGGLRVAVLLRRAIPGAR